MDCVGSAPDQGRKTGRAKNGRIMEWKVKCWCVLDIENFPSYEDGDGPACHNFILTFTQEYMRVDDSGNAIPGAREWLLEEILHWPKP